MDKGLKTPDINKSGHPRYLLLSKADKSAVKVKSQSVNKIL